MIWILATFATVMVVGKHCFPEVFRTIDLQMGMELYRKMNPSREDKLRDLLDRIRRSN